MGQPPRNGAALQARVALAGAALLQALVATVVAVILLGWLRDIIRDPGRWAWAALLVWMILFAPIVGWAGLTLIWTPGLARGQRTEWRRAVIIWSIVAVIGALGALVGLPGMAPRALVWAAFAIGGLLLVGGRAVDRQPLV